MIDPNDLLPDMIIDFVFEHLVFALWLSWPIILAIQLLRRRLSRRRMALSAFGLVCVIVCILLAFLSLGFILEHSVFRFFTIVSSLFAVISLIDFRMPQVEHYTIYPFWKMSWFISVMIVSLIAMTGYELGCRGPIEVTIEANDANREDFVLGAYYYPSGGRLKGIAGYKNTRSYNNTRIAKAGETIIFPRKYVDSSFSPFKWGDVINKTFTINIFVEHPKYKYEVKKLSLPYDFFRNVEKITLRPTHWDEKFSQLKRKINKRPDKVLEYRYVLLEQFRYSIGRLDDNWLKAFPVNKRRELANKYLPWINDIRVEYPEIMCASLLECRRKIKEGTLGEYEPTSYPFY